MISKTPANRRQRLDTEHNTASTAILRQRARAVRRQWSPEETEDRMVPEIYAMVDFLRMLTTLPADQ